MTNLEATSDYIFDFARERQIIEFVEQAMQGPIVPLNVELFIKPPRSQGITPAHQDHAFCRFKETTTILTCWIALDDAAREGGALEYARGRFSRLMPHKPHEEIHFSFELCDASELTFDSVPVRRAGCLIHHGFAIHRSGPNLLNYPRRAVAFAYRGCRDR
jgi:ectoine hydroxylase-related dioxygenase (phytanoyl-CoA dioxygenase family)